MEYITAKEASEKWGISARRVQVLCAQNRIAGAVRLGWAWAIPKSAEKPRDKRKKKFTTRLNEIGEAEVKNVQDNTSRHTKIL
ncbi:helix-turn-helix domain-containing protein [Clostridium tepidum]|jgi:hypothetical protein|uniref:helix-turn-helix domain-containing protein n=1 Tax=Clostridium tepidum TaxID=1962263 RepID=UPI00214A2C44|nr:helix-turn-helix domain-containing protein [Clostridium tepidum]MCR1934403.1 helix-turn-helix domain-containing protein [Clostridium tepidum]